MYLLELVAVSSSHDTEWSTSVVGGVDENLVDLPKLFIH